jgi:chemotaxis-related protein WspB
MQLLVFTVGAEGYAIESRRVIEVLPLVNVRPIPRMPDSVRGIFTHRGRLVPLVDLARLLTDRPLRETLSTRVIVVEFSTGPDEHRVRLGVAAENVLSLCSSDGAEASLPSMRLPDAPALGRLVRIGGQTIQVLDVEHLLPPAMIASLATCPPGSTVAPSAT